MSDEQEPTSSTIPVPYGKYPGLERVLGIKTEPAPPCEPYLADQPDGRRERLASLHRTLLHLGDRVTESERGLVDHALAMLAEAFPDPPAPTDD